MSSTKPGNCISSNFSCTNFSSLYNSSVLLECHQNKTLSNSYPISLSSYPTPQFLKTAAEKPPDFYTSHCRSCHFPRMSQVPASQPSKVTLSFNPTLWLPSLVSIYKLLSRIFTLSKMYKHIAVEFTHIAKKI